MIRFYTKGLSPNMNVFQSPKEMDFELALSKAGCGCDEFIISLPNHPEVISVLNIAYGSIGIGPLCP